MKGNVAGLLVVAAALFLIVMGIKGSQHALFPMLFGDTGTNVPQYNANIPNPNPSGHPGKPNCFPSSSTGNQCPTCYSISASNSKECCFDRNAC